MSLKSQVVIRQSLRKIFRPVSRVYENNLLQKIKEKGGIPVHLGVILDGNRHYAKSVGIPLKMGWTLGQKRVQNLVSWCLETGVEIVTVWAFSNENFNREKSQVDDLMEVFAESANEIIQNNDLVKKGVKVQVIGNLSKFKPELVESFKKIEEKTKNGQNLILNVAVGYSGRDEVVEAVQKMQAKNEEVSEENITKNLYTYPLPDPDLIIRTSGEIRTSGFLLWQASYSEFYFSRLYWPEFSRIDFLNAISNYQKRQRRFGK